MYKKRKYKRVYGFYVIWSCKGEIEIKKIGIFKAMVESGLGWYINWQKSWAEFSKMYAAIIIICVIFIAVNWVLTKIRKTVLKWQEVN